MEFNITREEIESICKEGVEAVMGLVELEEAEGNYSADGKGIESAGCETLPYCMPS